MAEGLAIMFGAITVILCILMAMLGTEHDRYKKALTEIRAIMNAKREMPENCCRDIKLILDYEKIESNREERIKVPTLG